MAKITNFGALSTLLADTSTISSSFNPNQVKDSKKQRYNVLMRGINMWSFSTFGVEHKCPRKLSINKLRLAAKNKTFEQAPPDFFETNQDFIFGQAVETGIQAAFLQRTPQEIFWDMFMAWTLPLDCPHPKGYEKEFFHSYLAVEKFTYIIQHDPRFVGWEVAIFNNKPAIELAFVLDLGEEYYYVGHVDLILFNPMTGRYKVVEIKTTGLKNTHEARYKNSDQATGYSIILDSIAKDQELTATFEVIYIEWNTSKNEWIIFEFTKNRSYRAQWINTILLDIQQIKVFKQLGFWPKRGAACHDWRPCEYLDICDLNPEHFNVDGFDVVSREEIEAQDFDFRFTIQDVIETQRELV